MASAVHCTKSALEVNLHADSWKYQHICAHNRPIVCSRCGPQCEQTISKVYWHRATDNAATGINIPGDRGHGSCAHILCAKLQHKRPVLRQSRHGVPEGYHSRQITHLVSVAIAVQIR
jgi:hypothetical protein